MRQDAGILNIQLIETNSPALQISQEFNVRSQKSMKAKGLRSSKFSRASMSNVTSKPDLVENKDPAAKSSNVIVNINSTARKASSKSKLSNIQNHDMDSQPQSNVQTIRQLVSPPVSPSKCDV